MVYVMVRFRFPIILLFFVKSYTSVSLRFVYYLQNRNNLQFIIHATKQQKKLRRATFRAHSVFHGFRSVFQYAALRYFKMRMKERDWFLLILGTKSAMACCRRNDYISHNVFSVVKNGAHVKYFVVKETNFFTLVT